MEKQNKIKELYINEILKFKEKYLKYFIGILGVSLVISFIIYIVLVLNPEMSTSAMGELVSIFEDKGFTSEVETQEVTFIVLVKNNLKVVAASVFLGVMPVPVIPALSSVTTISTIGILLSFITISGGSPLGALIYGILPHGIIEIPSLVLSGSLGMYLSSHVFKSITFTKEEFDLDEIMKEVIITFILVVVPMIILSAFIEGFVTSLILGI